MPHHVQSSLWLVSACVQVLGILYPVRAGRCGRAYQRELVTGLTRPAIADAETTEPSQ